MVKTQMITQNQIAERAFKIWEDEGHPHGRDEDHWKRAEAELRETMSRMTTPPKRAAKAQAKPETKAVKPKSPRASRAKAKTA